MTRRALIKQLKQLKDSENAGKPSERWVNENREILMMQIKNSFQQKKFFDFKCLRELPSFVFPSFTKYALRTVLVPLLALGLVFGSYIVTVSASLNSLPGDPLYTLKIAAERAQVVLAIDEDSKAKLRVEFAGRRLEEVAKIIESGDADKQAEVGQTLNKFKEQIKTVKNELEKLKQDSKSGKAVEIAKMVEEKTIEYGALLEKAAGVLSSSIQVDIREASNLIDETGISAFEVMVQGGSALGEDEIANRIALKIEIIKAKGQPLDIQTILEEAEVLLEEKNLSAALSLVAEAVEKAATAYHSVPEEGASAPNNTNEVQLFDAGLETMSTDTVSSTPSG